MSEAQQKKKKSKKINGSVLETRWLISDLWHHQHPYRPEYFRWLNTWCFFCKHCLRIRCDINNWTYLLYFGISVRQFSERAAVWVVHRSMAVSTSLHQDPAWHQGEEKQRKDSHQLPLPGTPFVSSGRQLQSIKNKTTHHLNSSFSGAANITNPLTTHPLPAATISGKIFLYLSTKWNHYDVFVS